MWQTRWNETRSQSSSPKACIKSHIFTACLNNSKVGPSGPQGNLIAEGCVPNRWFFLIKRALKDQIDLVDILETGDPSGNWALGNVGLYRQWSHLEANWQSMQLLKQKCYMRIPRNHCLSHCILDQVKPLGGLRGQAHEEHLYRITVSIWVSLASWRDSLWEILVFKHLKGCHIEESVNLFSKG